MMPSGTASPSRSVCYAPNSPTIESARAAAAAWAEEGRSPPERRASRPAAERAAARPGSTARPAPIRPPVSRAAAPAAATAAPRPPILPYLCEGGVAGATVALAATHFVGWDDLPHLWAAALVGVSGGMLLTWGLIQ